MFKREEKLKWVKPCEEIVHGRCNDEALIPNEKSMFVILLLPATRGSPRNIWIVSYYYHIITNAICMLVIIFISFCAKQFIKLLIIGTMCVHCDSIWLSWDIVNQFVTKLVCVCVCLCMSVWSPREIERERRHLAVVSPNPTLGRWAGPLSVL